MLFGAKLSFSGYVTFIICPTAPFSNASDTIVPTAGCSSWPRNKMQVTVWLRTR